METHRAFGTQRSRSGRNNSTRGCFQPCRASKHGKWQGAAVTATAAVTAVQSKPTGGAPAAAQGPAAAAEAAAGRLDAPPAHIAAPAYSAVMKRAGQPCISLAPADILNGLAATPAKLVGEPLPCPDATAAVPAVAAGAGCGICGEAVDNIQPIGAKAAAGMRKQEGGRGGAVGAVVVPEGNHCPLQRAAADLSDHLVCS